MNTQNSRGKRMLHVKSIPLPNEWTWIIKSSSEEVQKGEIMSLVMQKENRERKISLTIEIKNIYRSLIQESWKDTVYDTQHREIQL